MHQARLTTATLLLSLLAAGTASAQSDRLFIDYVDTSQYEKGGGLLRYFVDVLDAQNRPIDKLDQNKLSFLLNNEPIPADKISGTELRTFEAMGEPFAVAILFTNYRGYVPKSTGEASLFSYSKAGILGFVGNLAKQRVRIRVDVYNEQGIDPVVEFTESQKNVKEALENLPEPQFLEGDGAEGPDVKIQAPDFYRHLDDTVKKMAALDDLPRRRLLIIISDGVGKESTAAKKKVLDAKLESVIEEAKDAGIKIYAFGATLGEDQFLPYVSSVAERTYGIYQKVDDPEALEGAIRDLAPKLLKQYVVDIKAPGLPNEKVALRIDAETPNKEKVSHTYPKQVLVPPTPTDWKKILTWVGIGVGSLVGLILFIWMIRKFLRWRADRPADSGPAESGPEPEYNGPHKGVLRVKTGPLAGTTFHLIEEITTIGSLDGNHIVLQTPGVSKRHAGIKIEDMRYELADFGSTNGTWVNGRKINRQFMKDGDEIRIGDSEMSFNLK
jgi:hypothetical protein